jgi:hypothetical protein
MFAGVVRNSGNRSGLGTSPPAMGIGGLLGPRFACFSAKIDAESFNVGL